MTRELQIIFGGDVPAIRAPGWQKLVTGERTGARPALVGSIFRCSAVSLWRALTPEGVTNRATEASRTTAEEPMDM